MQWGERDDTGDAEYDGDGAVRWWWSKYYLARVASQRDQWWGIFLSAAGQWWHAALHMVVEFEDWGDQLGGDTAWVAGGSPDEQRE